MRHQYSLVLAGFVLIAGAVPSGQERQIGLKAGVSVASIAGDAGGDAALPYDVRTGLTGGAFAVFPMRRRVALQVEAILTDKGGALPVNDPSIIQGEISERLRFQYLDLPVLARLTGPRVKSATLYGFAGPTLSVRLSARYQTAMTGAGSYGFEYDIGQDVRRFDVGLTAGAGADIGPRLVIDARYTRGFTDLYDVAAGVPLRNRGFLVTAGFRIF
ncbi:MAG TPA: porin family protein [Vicinamibacterales bacterium]|nr:porin family protein [Vicinamibacterales bacterium]